MVCTNFKITCLCITIKIINRKQDDLHHTYRHTAIHVRIEQWNENIKFVINAYDSRKWYDHIFVCAIMWEEKKNHIQK